MSKVQPGAASTLPESTRTTPAALQPRYIGTSCLIWVENKIDHEKSVEVLEKKWATLKDSPVRHAIWDGIWSLKQDIDKCAEAAKQRGLLLLCWENTTARRVRRA